MPYSPLPDRGVAYDVDGCAAYWNSGGHDTGIDTPALTYALGAANSVSGTDLQTLNTINDTSIVVTGHDTFNSGYQSFIAFWLFAPEQRVWSAIRTFVSTYAAPDGVNDGVVEMEGSNDTTTGVDGTWEVASLSSIAQSSVAVRSVDWWRSGWAGISFSGPKKVIRFALRSEGRAADLYALHLYAHKGSGQTPDDLIFLDTDGGGGEFAADEDFGDRPLGTTVVRTFQVKNVSGTKTASSILVQCSDADWAISTDGVTYVSSFTIASLAPGVSSPTYYLRNTTPAIGSSLLPRYARVTLSGYSFA